MNTMATVKEFIDYLSSQPGLQVRWLGSDAHLDAPITHIQTDSDARTGHLAWISQKQFQVRSDAIQHFQGALLLGPLDAIAETPQPFLSCNKPKLAFILAVSHFFSDVMDTSWRLAGKSVSPDAEVHPGACLGPGVVIGPRVKIAENVEIGPNTVLANTTIQENVRIGANCSIGLAGFGYEADETGKYWRFPHTGGVFIAGDVEIGSNTCIDRGSIGDTVIGRGVKIDNLVHVAHNVHIGADSLIIANTMLGGSVSIGENSWVAPSVSVMNQVQIGAYAVVGLGAVVLKNVEERAVMVGNPAKFLRRNEE